MGTISTAYAFRRLQSGQNFHNGAPGLSAVDRVVATAAEGQYPAIALPLCEIEQGPRCTLVRPPRIHQVRERIARKAVGTRLEEDLSLIHI